MSKVSRSKSECAEPNSRTPLSFLFSVGNLVVTITTDIHAASLCLLCVSPDNCTLEMLGRAGLELMLV